MTWRLRGWRSPGDDDARLDALLAGTWAAAAEATGKVLDFQAGKEALLAACEQQQPPSAAGRAVPMVSSEVSQPPALTGYRQPRKQRRTVRALVVAGAVAVLAGGVLTAAGVTGVFGSGRGQQIQTAAYITRVEHALTTQAEQGLVGYSRTVFPPGTVIEQTAVNSWETKPPAPGAASRRSPLTAEVMVTWGYQDNAADVVSTAAGQPVFADQIAATGRELTEVEVSYRDATWWRATQALGPGTEVPAPGCSRQSDPGLSNGWPAYIRQELSCGVYHQDGRQRVDGIDAVKLTGNRPRLILWINPVTYLPVRETELQGPPGWQPVQTDFRWFPVTAASLAHLKVSVPASFRQVGPP